MKKGWKYLLMLVLCSTMTTAYAQDTVMEAAYQRAKQLAEQGSYELAISTFEMLDGYADSEEQVVSCREAILKSQYQEALKLKDAGNFEAAKAAFTALGDYQDSTEQATACDSSKEEEYAAALALEEQGDYEAALAAFRALGNYQDSAKRLENCRKETEKAALQVQIEATLGAETVQSTAVLPLLRKAEGLRIAPEVLQDWMEQLYNLQTREQFGEDTRFADEDLNGDGIPERVLLVDGVIQVLEKSRDGLKAEEVVLGRPYGDIPESEEEAAGWTEAEAWLRVQGYQGEEPVYLLWDVSRKEYLAAVYVTDSDMRILPFIEENEDTATKAAAEETAGEIVEGVAKTEIVTEAKPEEMPEAEAATAEALEAETVAVTDAVPEEILATEMAAERVAEPTTEMIQKTESVTEEPVEPPAEPTTEVIQETEPTTDAPTETVPETEPTTEAPTEAALEAILTAVPATEPVAVSAPEPVVASETIEQEEAKTYMLTPVMGTISASSCLDFALFGPANLSDLNGGTAWLEGVDGLGEGESITWSFSSPVRIDGIAIMPGYQGDPQSYYRNSNPAELVLNLGGTQRLYEINDYQPDFANPSESIKYQDFPESYEVSYASVTIRKANKGIDLQHTGFSELFFYQYVETEGTVEGRPAVRYEVLPGAELPAETAPAATLPQVQETLPPVIQEPTLADASEYILPDSDSRYYTESELRGLSASQLKLARNEIYARHGRLFNNQELQSYFNSKSWYYGSIDPDTFDKRQEDIFNRYEKANRDLIVKLEHL